jgi:hypothetical protein
MRWIALLLPFACGAQDWGSLHIANANLPLGERLMLQFHSRLRTNDNFGDYFQSRGGAIASYRVRPRLSLIGGYYFADEEARSGTRSDFHRFFGGASVVLPSPSKLKLEARSLFERFAGTNSGGYFRARERMVVSFGTGKLRPYLQLEGLVQQGIVTGRFGAGAQFLMSGGRDVSIGFEHRQLSIGGYINLITSNFQFQLRAKRN